MQIPEVNKSRRPRFFYGWIIVLISAIADATAFGAGNASFAVFLQPMSAALGWSRTTLTAAVTIQSFGNLVSTPIVGIILDRYGARLIMVFGTVIAGISYMLMGRVNEPWQFYLLFTMAMAFGLHEVGGLVGTTVVSKWFIRKRGRALAFTTLGNNVGGILLAPLTAFLIGAVGWEATWALLGFLIVLVVLPPTILFMRRTPEDLGLLPDGDPPKSAESNAEAAPYQAYVHSEEPRWTVQEALRTRTLWILIASFNLASLGISALLYHQVAYFRDAGLSLEAAALTFSLYNAMAIVSKLLSGFLAERIPARYCIMGIYLCRVLGLLVLLLGTVPERVYFYAIISGLGVSIALLQPLIWADYYGRAFLGTIRGVLSPFSLVTSLGGPIFAAVVFDSTGSYDAAFWVFTVTLTAAAVLIFFARPPGLAPTQSSSDLPLPMAASEGPAMASPTN